MASKTTAPLNRIEAAIEQVHAEWLGGAQDLKGDELKAYVAQLDELTSRVRDIRGQYLKAIRVEQSKKSIAKRKARVDAALALLAEAEAAEAAEATTAVVVDGVKVAETRRVNA